MAEVSSTQFSLKARLLPLFIVQGYLLATVLLFAFGPWPWPVANPERLYLFLFASQGLLAAGYLSALHKKPGVYTGRISVSSLCLLSSVVVAVLFFPTLQSTIGGGDINLASLSDPAAAYLNYTLAQQSKEGTAVVTYIRSLLSPLLVMAFPVTFILWHQNSWFARGVGVVSALTAPLLFILTGRNKGIVDIALLVPWIVLVAFCSGRFRPSRKAIALSSLTGVLLLGGAGFVFNQSIQGRVGTGATIAMPIVFPQGSLIYSNKQNVILQNSPAEYHDLIRGLSFYVNHGYYGLSMALDKPFEPSNGVAHSAFLQIVASRLTGVEDPAPNSFVAKLDREDGWSKTILWHTTYTWFAGDVGFLGVLVLVFFLGRLLFLSWLDSLNGQNPYAAAMLLLLVTVCLYLPVNNIVLGFGDTYGGFWVCLIMWLMTRNTPESSEAAS